MKEQHFNWNVNSSNYWVEIDQPSNNRVNFNTNSNIMSIPDKEESEPLNFNCTSLNFAEVILMRFLQARKKTLKPQYIL